MRATPGSCSAFAASFRVWAVFLVADQKPKDHRFSQVIAFSRHQGQETCSAVCALPVAKRVCLVTQPPMPGALAQPLLPPTGCAGGLKTLAGIFRSSHAHRPLACTQTRCQRQDAADISLEEAATQLRPHDAALDSGVASTSGSEQAISFLPDFQTVPYTHRGGCAALVLCRLCKASVPAVLCFSCCR